MNEQKSRTLDPVAGREPEKEKSVCPYCANAPTNHRLSYAVSLISQNVDPHIAMVVRHAPQFLKNFVDSMRAFVFPILAVFHLAEFSDDIEKANTFRSRVVWEEARRRGIKMQQVIVFGKPLEVYRAKIKGRYVYFESLPVPPKMLESFYAWDRDNKSILKRVFDKHNIPVPKCAELSVFRNTDKGLSKRAEKIFNDLEKPVIVKPKLGSRGRHTTTNINTFEEYKNAISIARQLSPYLIVEEHLEGDVCRATIVDGRLAGFYRASAPAVIGDGARMIKELIEEKNKNRSERVEAVEISDEIKKYLGRSGLTFESVPKTGERVQLTYRTGRLFGGITREMIDTLHPSFVPILEKAGQVADLTVAGFDCIIPDPTRSASSQKWGIIECNTLPFIDLHYYALEGKPRNIAGMIWDLWDKKESR